MRNVSDKFVEKIEPRISFLIKFFENRAIYEVMWKYIVEPAGEQTTIWRMRIAC
jgi:hypothetical protein